MLLELNRNLLKRDFREAGTGDSKCSRLENPVCGRTSWISKLSSLIRAMSVTRINDHTLALSTCHQFVRFRIESSIDSSIVTSSDFDESQ